MQSLTRSLHPRCCWAKRSVSVRPVRAIDDTWKAQTLRAHACYPRLSEAPVNGDDRIGSSPDRTKHGELALCPCSVNPEPWSRNPTAGPPLCHLPFMHRSSVIARILGFALTGRSSQQDRLDESVKDVCTQWSWDNGQDDGAMGDFLQQNMGEGVYADDVINDAKGTCPERLRKHADYEGALDAYAAENDPSNFSSDKEEEFATTDHSCEKLQSWCKYNPGDSNLDIACQYLDVCGTAPPPVLSGELSEEDLG